MLHRLIENTAPKDLEPELNIVGEIERSAFETLQKDAQYAMLNPKGTFIQSYYKFTDTKINDGTTRKEFQYLTSRGMWHNSAYNNQDYDKLKDKKFLKIIN